MQFHSLTGDNKQSAAELNDADADDDLISCNRYHCTPRLLCNLYNGLRWALFAPKGIIRETSERERPWANWARRGRHKRKTGRGTPIRPLIYQQ